MTITLRARPTCHYCGKRNRPSHSSESKFTCQYCQAENYLDDSGNITDVPSTATASSKRYVIPIMSSFESPEGSIFCSTCLKNQYMYNAALAEYLPDPDHPEYDRFEAAIPDFKIDLERRFPTCCANCEPRVKAQLQQATYNARSDHIRRVLDRSRQRRVASRWGWRSLLVSTAGLGWAVSLIIQLLWHAVASQTNSDMLIPDMHPIVCLTMWPIPMGCSVLVERYVGPSLLLGVLCIWWNPKWQHKIEGREGRLVGLDRFYKAQGAILTLRFAAWTVTTDIPRFAQLRPMLHTVSLVVIVMNVAWSYYNIIKIATPQIVDWSKDPAPLLDSSQYVPPEPRQILSPPNSQEAIPVDVFGTSANNPLRSWRPPTPPVDEDVMEWDPTPSTFSPNLKKINYKNTDPTPFRGTLPALSRGGIYQTKAETTLEQPQAIGLPIGFFDKSHGKRIENKADQSKGIELAQPKFFHDAARADTGLENIFDSVFSLQDKTFTPRKAPGSVQTSHQGFSTSVSSEDQIVYPPVISLSVENMYNMIISLALLASILVTYVDELQILNALAVVSAISILDLVMHVYLSYFVSTTKLSFATITPSVVQTTASLMLVYFQSDTQISSVWPKLAQALLLAMFFQSAYKVCTKIKAFPQATDPGRLRGERNAGVPVGAIPQQPQADAQSQVSAPTNFQTLRRSSSDESLASTASIATTSTASGWKTPVKNHREEMRNIAGSTSYGLGGLSLKNDHNFGSGVGVAGPRNRRMPGRGDQRGW